MQFSQNRTREIEDRLSHVNQDVFSVARCKHIGVDKREHVNMYLTP